MSSRSLAGTESGESPRAGSAPVHVPTYADAGGLAASRARASRLCWPWSWPPPSSTAILNLYVDVQAKLREQFRDYGANIVVVGNDGAALPADTLRTVETTLAGRGLAVPFAYAVARTAEGQSVVVSGTDFRQARTLDQWWSVDRLAQRARGSARGGARAGGSGSPGKAFCAKLWGTYQTVRIRSGRLIPGRLKTAEFISPSATLRPGPGSSLLRLRSRPRDRRSKWMGLSRSWRRLYPAPRCGRYGR